MFERINRLTDWAVSRAVAHLQQTSNAAQYATELVRLRYKLEEERRAAGERIADLESETSALKNQCGLWRSEYNAAITRVERMEKSARKRDEELAELEGIVHSKANCIGSLTTKLALAEEERDMARAQREEWHSEHDAMMEERDRVLSKVRELELREAEFTIETKARATELLYRLESQGDHIDSLKRQLIDERAISANMRPKREMPEGWRVDPSRDGLAAYRDGRYSVYITRVEALALAAYLDSEEPTQCP